MIRLSRRFCVVVVASVLACGSPEAHFATKFASDFTPAGHRMSVFGVYKDGQMSSGAWGDLRPSVERALGGSTCEIAYDGELASSNGLLFTAIDDYTRANGPTDDLLTQLAPAAQGDLIMVLTEAGKLPVHAKISVADPPRTGRGRGARGGGDPNVLQLSASLFSVAQRRSVALVDMQYSGASVDEAMGKFAARLSQSLPAATCRGWNWSTNVVDPERIRKLGDE